MHWFFLPKIRSSPTSWSERARAQMPDESRPTNVVVISGALRFVSESFARNRRSGKNVIASSRTNSAIDMVSA